MCLLLNVHRYICASLWFHRYPHRLRHRDVPDFSSGYIFVFRPSPFDSPLLCQMLAYLQCPSICQRIQGGSWNFYLVFCGNEIFQIFLLLLVRETGIFWFVIHLEVIAAGAWTKSWICQKKKSSFYFFCLKCDQTTNKDEVRFDHIPTLVIIIFQEKNWFLFIFHF